MLVLDRREMADLIGNLRTRAGKPDRMFYCAFNSKAEVVLTRGAVEHRDITQFTFSNRAEKIRKFLGAA
jgi:hypothetical protein